MNTRRSFVQYALFGIAAVATPVAGFAATALHPGFLFHPLGPDAELGLGWRLQRVYPPAEGAVTVTLAHADGRQVRVDVCLRSGAPRGPASTELLDFIVMDGGDGTAVMDESLGRALRRLAAIAAENEASDPARIRELAPHAERLWAHPEAMAAASQRLVPGAPAA
jgi:hypothetical protein